MQAISGDVEGLAYKWAEGNLKRKVDKKKDIQDGKNRVNVRVGWSCEPCEGDEREGSVSWLNLDNPTVIKAQE